jgi:hypothetical protein
MLDTGFTQEMRSAHSATGAEKGCAAPRPTYWPEINQIC